MEILRTPDDRFVDLSEYPFTPHYVDVVAGSAPALRMHYLDEGADAGLVILLLHGEPTWSYAYRKVIPPLVAAGLHIIAPDLIGFGRSDKPAAIADYSYRRQIAWMSAFLEQLGLQDITLFCHDWGGLIGLRLVAQMPRRFSAVVAANTLLPTGSSHLPAGFRLWRAFARYSPWLPIGLIIRAGCTRAVRADVLRGYSAPFPSARYMVGARALPRLVPSRKDEREALANRSAWQALARFERPFLTAFGARDPILGKFDRVFQQRIAGARNQAHRRLEGGGHFVQEDCPGELAEILIGLCRSDR